MALVRRVRSFPADSGLMTRLKRVLSRCGVQVRDYTAMLTPPSAPLIEYPRLRIVLSTLCKSAILNRVRYNRPANWTSRGRAGIGRQA